MGKMVSDEVILIYLSVKKGLPAVLFSSTQTSLVTQCVMLRKWLLHFWMQWFKTVLSSHGSSLTSAVDFM
jgi:hypothetical protein